MTGGTFYLSLVHAVVPELGASSSLVSAFPTFPSFPPVTSSNGRATVKETRPGNLARCVSPLSRFTTHPAHSDSASSRPSQNLVNCLDLVTAFEEAKAVREAQRNGSGSSSKPATPSVPAKATSKTSTAAAKKGSAKKAVVIESSDEENLSLQKHDERRKEAKKKAARKSSAFSPLPPLSALSF
jgi:hypothetical protein